MKKLYLGLFFAGVMFFGHAQQKAKTPLEIADTHYNNYEFVEAATVYQKMVRGAKTDVYVYQQLADCYYNVFNSVEAAKNYAKLIEKEPGQEADVYYRYAQMLKASGRYETSNEIMKHFAKLAPDDQRAIAFQRDPNYIPKLRSQEELFTFEDTGINDLKGSDFGAFLTKFDTLYFTSTRAGTGKTYGWNDQPYLDIYRARYKGIYEPLVEVEAVPEVNTPYHDGPVTISEDGKTMFFATESFRQGDFVRKKSKRIKLGQVSLYRATKKGEKWTNIKGVSFNGKDYSVSNPSLSADGKTLYFASDMPGTMGGMDIWKVTLNDDGTYGVPLNLGAQVNTEGRESFPFVAVDNKLYFASDSRKGFGGLDVYVVDLVIPKAEPKNLGTPINTAKDDFSFSFYPEKHIGFFSTNRIGRDDIYKAIPICNTEMYITVSNEKTGELLPGAIVSIFDDRRNLIETKTADDRGIVEYVVDCNKFFNLQVSKEDFESKTVEVPMHRGGRQQVAVTLRPIEVIIKDEQILLGDIYFEFNKSNITREGAFELDKLVQVMKRHPNMNIKVGAHTDSRGSDVYNLKLSQQRATTTKQYILSKGIESYRLESEGYGESQPKINCGDNCTEEEHAINRRSEFMIIKK